DGDVQHRRQRGEDDTEEHELHGAASGCVGARRLHGAPEDTQRRPARQGDLGVTWAHGRNPVYAPPAMRSQWIEADAEEGVQRWAPRWGEELALRVYTSRLLGREASLVLHGGGNTSAKGVAREITGAEVSVLWVKGSGWDLAAIEPEGFPACRMRPLLDCLAPDRLADQD